MEISQIWPELLIHIIINYSLRIYSDLIEKLTIIVW